MADNGEVTGFDELIANLQAIGTRIANTAINTALKAGAQPLVDAMKSNVRVSSLEHEHIRDDIMASGIKTDPATGMKYILVGPGTNTNWRARFLEFGTKKMSAFPFMFPSLNQAQGTVYEAMAEVMSAAIAKGGGGNA